MEDFGIDPVEAHAISLARSLGVPVLLASLRKKLLTYDDYQDSLEDLVKAGFRMSDEVYLEAVRLGRRKL